MYPHDLKSDPLDRKNRKYDIGKDYSRPLVKHITHDLNDIQHNGKEIDIVKFGMLEKRLDKPVQCTDQHIDTDHIDRKVRSLQFRHKGEYDPVYIGDNIKYDHLYL
jgi:hypothetical protein